MALNRDKPRSLTAAVLEAHGDAHGRQDSGSRLGPLDEDDRVVEVGLEVSPLRRGDVPEAEEVEMRDVDAPVIAVADREGRARDGIRHAQRTACPPDEGRLAGAELPGDGDDVPNSQVGDELRCELFGLGRRVCFRQKSPSWTAGSAVTGVRKTGWGGGATSRPSSSGSRAKSAFSTSSIRGV
jgi:hypothetical protein